MRLPALLMLFATACTGAAPAPEANAEGVPEVPKADCPECPKHDCPVVEDIECAEVTAQPSVETQSSKEDSLSLEAVKFSDLPEWETDDHSGAVSSLLRSCALFVKMKKSAKIGVPDYAGKVRDWLPACKAAKKVAGANQARAFFEKHFRPYAAHGSAGSTAKFTGYYVQSARGSLRRHGKYQTPLMRRPADLVETQLSNFIPDGRGRRIWGRQNPTTGHLEPYPTRAEIRREGLKQDQVLVWLDDPVDAVFAEIQGSAVVKLDDGTTRWAAFDGKNGRKFRGVGGILRRMGELKRGEGTMQGTRAWFDKNRERYHEIVDKNTAKVFFKFEDRAGAIGTQNVVLTPRRSVAIDRAAIAFGTPIWVDARAPVGKNGKNVKWRQLLIAQDTGGAILGPVRADIYWGEGKAAEAIAGRMGGKGRLWLLLPARLKVPTK